MNRQKLILLCLLVLLALAIAWGYFRMPRQQTVSELQSVSGQRRVHLKQNAMPPSAAMASADQGGGESLRLDLLDREVSVFHGYRRNLFKPVFVDQAKVVKVKPVPVKPRPLPPLPLPVIPAVAEKPRLELAKFTFLGFLLRDNRRTVFLARDKEIILVNNGDVFAGRYEAASITDKALTIRVTDTGEEMVIPLVEYSSLIPAR